MCSGKRFHLNDKESEILTGEEGQSFVRVLKFKFVSLKRVPLGPIDPISIEKHFRS